MDLTANGGRGTEVAVFLGSRCQERSSLQQAEVGEKCLVQALAILVSLSAGCCSLQWLQLILTGVLPQSSGKVGSPSQPSCGRAVNGSETEVFGCPLY